MNQKEESVSNTMVNHGYYQPLISSRLFNVGDVSSRALVSTLVSMVKTNKTTRAAIDIVEIPRVRSRARELTRDVGEINNVQARQNISRFLREFP